MKNIVLFGPPGAGKGTQAQLLKEKYGLAHISTGDVIRDNIRRDTALGQSVKQYIEKGELAPDQLVIDIIADYVVQHSDTAGNIFDGFPRTTHQAEEFDRIMVEHGLKVDMMLSLDVPDKVLVDRITLRAVDSGRADDADPRVVENRIEVYKAQTAVVADYYRKQGKYAEVDGIGTVEEVFSRLCRAIEE